MPTGSALPVAVSGDQSVLKQLNRMAIVRLVKNRPGVARADLAELLGLADSTISALVKELTVEGWILSSSRGVVRAGAGRRPKRLTLNPGRLAVLGAEIGADYIAVAACNLTGQKLFSRVVAYTHVDEARSVADTALLLAEARSRLKKLGRESLGVGLGVPGMVTHEGLLLFAPNLGWRNVPIGQQLADALARQGAGGLPVTVLNDANACALSEYVFGHAVPRGSLVYLTVGSGIGAGLVIDDHLVLGHEGFAGEIGHTITDPGGYPCTCGRRGCAETVLSQKGVSRLVTGNEDTILTMSELMERFERKDPAAFDAARIAGEQLGLVVHNVLVLMNPATVVLGGPLSRMPTFVETALSRLRWLAGASSSHHALVRKCSFGASAGAVGAAASVLHDALHPVTAARAAAS